MTKGFNQNQNMIINRIVKTGHFFYASFAKFTSKLFQVQNQASTKQKNLILNAFLNTQCSQTERNAAKNIFTFVNGKKSTNIAKKSLVSFIKKYVNPVNASQSANNYEQADLQEFLVSVMPKQRTGDGQVTLQEVDLFLVALAEAEGRDSSKYKYQLMVNLMDRMSNEEIIMLFRVILKKLRIGLLKIKSDKVQNDGGQNIDLQEKNGVKEKLKEKLKKQEKDENKKQRYLETNFQFMLAKPLRSVQQVQKFCRTKEDQKIVADLKYDGQRSLVIYQRQQPIQLLSRNKKIQTTIYQTFANQLSEQLDQIKHIQSIQIDGEIVCVNKQGQHLLLQQLFKKRGKQVFDEPESTLKYFAFDVIQFNGKPVKNQELIKRRELIPETNMIKKSSVRLFDQEKLDQLMEYFQELLSRKYQGLILKGERDLYHINGSRKYWGKLKKGIRIYNTDTGQIDLDLVVMGGFYGQGKRRNTISAYLLGVYHEGKYHPISKVGTGFTDEQLVEYTNIFINYMKPVKPESYEIPSHLKVDCYFQPKKVFQVRSQNITRSSVYQLGFVEGKGGLSLRFPVFERIREDKDPESCNFETLGQYMERQMI